MMTTIGFLFLFGLFLGLMWLCACSLRYAVKAWKEGRWRASPWMALLSLIFFLTAIFIAFSARQQWDYLENVTKAGYEELGTFNYQGEPKKIYLDGSRLCFGERRNVEPVIEGCFEPAE